MTPDLQFALLDNSPEYPSQPKLTLTTLRPGHTNLTVLLPDSTCEASPDYPAALFRKFNDALLSAGLEPGVFTHNHHDGSNRAISFTFETAKLTPAHLKHLTDMLMQEQLCDAYHQEKILQLTQSYLRDIQPSAAVHVHRNGILAAPESDTPLMVKR